MKKRYLGLFVALCMLLTLVPATVGLAEYADKIVISMDTIDAEKINISAKDAFIREKFNIDWNLFPVTWGDWTEKVRAWVAADDMPDVLWWDMKIANTAEFRVWAAAGAFREIPADLSKWPNLAQIRSELTSDDDLLSIDGKLYGWSAGRKNPAWLQNAYYPLFAYRRDWAKAVGLYKEGDAYTWEEAKALIKAVKEQDPGKNGEGNTIGITMETWALSQLVPMEILGIGADINPYVKTDDGYVPYFTLPTAKEEMLFVTDLFQNGYIWKDQFVDSGADGANNFKAGKSFMHLGNNSPAWLSVDAYPKMVDTGIVSSTADVAPMIVYSPVDDKSLWLKQTEDYWTVSHITHPVSDEKMERILDLWDWLASEEGRIFTVAGLEGKDYSKNDDGTYNILWNKNADGSFISPYVDNAFNIYTPATLWPSPNETSRMDGFIAFEGIDTFMQTSPDYNVHLLDPVVNAFGGELYSTYGGFASDYSGKCIELFASAPGTDVGAAWDAWLKEMEPKWRPVADELNAALLQ